MRRNASVYVEHAMKLGKKEFTNGMTVRQLKDLIRDWPEDDINGEPTEVWVDNKDGTSRPVFAVWPLNLRKGHDGVDKADVLLA